MTRSDLVHAVYLRHGGMSRREAQDVVDLILGRVVATLVAGKRVEILGFGTFAVVASPARAGRHPITGRRFTVAPARSLQFRASKRLREQVNDSGRADAWRESGRTSLSAATSGEGLA